MSKVTILNLREVDETRTGARVVARFNVQIDGVRIYDVELRSTDKGLAVHTPANASIAWGLLTKVRRMARDKLKAGPVPA